MNNYQKGKIVQSYEAGDFIGELIEGESNFNSNMLISEENAILWKMNKDRFYGLLSDNINIARKVVDHLKVA